MRVRSVFKVYLTLAGLGVLVGGCASFREGAPEKPCKRSLLGIRPKMSFFKSRFRTKVVGVNFVTPYSLFLLGGE